LILINKKGLNLEGSGLNIKYCSLQAASLMRLRSLRLKPKAAAAPIRGKGPGTAVGGVPAI
jgi:hypothetical protein